MATVPVSQKYIGVLVASADAGLREKIVATLNTNRWPVMSAFGGADALGKRVASISSYSRPRSSPRESRMRTEQSSRREQLIAKIDQLVSTPSVEAVLHPLVTYLQQPLENLDLQRVVDLIFA
jgi:hypothetical protein